VKESTTLSKASLFLLIAGLVLIAGAYRRALTKKNINTIIKVWSEPGTPKNISNSETPTLAKLQRKLYRQNGLLIAVAYFIIITNTQFNYLRGWYVLGFCGFLISYLYMEFQKMPSKLLLESQRSSFPDEFRITQEELHREKIQQSKGPAIAVVVVTFLAAIGWANEVQQNQFRTKLSAMNSLSDLVGDGWCANFWDVSLNRGLDGHFDVSKSGGWPCITIASVTDIRFIDNLDSVKMCLNYALARSRGMPDDNYYSLPFKFDTICSSDKSWELSEGWDKDSVFRKIRNEKKMDKALDRLQVEMCQLFRFRLSETERIVYCSLD